ncbi:hypothetical protein SAMN04489761_4676 [Tenacibaculum sp. MAR_2009_124]|uniref:hypothetical protein n=1 Tax=Tenacibaculum sp. MAR_2009_124 TaxID=1250059 RepID=UPI000896FA34|nr:hypothetical protein [Tenacibaculum sp. MAR_2009_124]SED22241.1 hypothetical protein SAMN04489761_4676 [Tenacibaculum sp. MAR_2009_124]
MKTTMKIAVIAMMVYCTNAISQSNFKRYSKNLIVNNSSSKELTDETDNSLNINNVYRIRLVTRGTGTDTGAEYLAWSSNSIWNIRAVNLKGNNSNHPILTINDNIIKVKTNHPNNYSVRAFIEELVSEEGDAVANIFGSSYQWQRKINDLFYTDGNIGIGTISPNAKLDVVGNIKVTGALNTIGNIKVTGGLNTSSSISSKQIKINDGNTDLMLYRDGDVGDWSLLRTNKGNGIGLIGKPDQVALSVSRLTGNVGIRTNDTKGFELGVNGKIAANEVKVAIYPNWPDFVFENDYNLPTLIEVENHIKEKGHLKDIPSAEEVEKYGFYLGKMDAKLLQKIEELTLYTIEQEKKMKSQKKKFDKQQNEIEELRKQNSEIKNLLEKLLKDKN